MSTRSITDLIKYVTTDYKKYAKTFTVSELVKILKKLSDSYYNTDTNLVSDEIYDNLKDLLESKDPEHPYLSEIGAPIKGTKTKVKLPYEMGSLTKIKPSTGDLEKWIVKYEGPYILSDKLDGASAQLYKNNNGKLFLYSRGDGNEGQDISHLISKFFEAELLDNLPKGTSVRGELIITKKNFSKISSYMKNARNAVAGLVNSKTVDRKIAHLTDFVSYGILYPKYNQKKQMELLKTYGFNVVKYEIVKKISDNIFETYLLERKKKSLYEMDGIVCVDNSKIYEQTGGHPDHMFAFKMVLDDQTTIATVVEVEWNVSMDGFLKPRIKIEPVDLMGTTVTYATGHNAKFIVDGKIGPNAQIKIIRSGDVIPYVLEIVKPAKSPQMPPFKCKWNDTNVDLIIDEKNEKLGNAIKLKLLVHFTSTMGIKFLGKGILEKFINNKIDTVAKILKTKPKDLEKIDGLGEKSIKKIYEEIDRAFDEVELATLMDASHKFGRGMGTRKMEEVLNKYPHILSEENSEDELIEKILLVPGFAERSAKLFAKNFKEFKKFFDELAKIRDMNRFILAKSNITSSDSDSDSDADSDSESDSDNNKLEGEKIVFTQIRDPSLEKFIKKNGGKVTTSVTGNTTLVVHKDGADISKGKIQEAIKKGIKTMSISEFKKKFNMAS